MGRDPALLGRRLPAESRLGGSGAHLSSPPRRAVARSRPLDPGVELRGGELADAGALQRPAGVDVGEGRAAADPVEAGDGAVAVVADRHPPAVLADQVADRVAIVAHVEREEAHPSTVALVDALTTSCWSTQSPPLVNQNEITSGRSKRSQTRIAPAVVIRQAGVRRASARAGQLRGRAVVLGDVGVAFERAGGGGDGELRQRPARRLAGRGRACPRRRRPTVLTTAIDDRPRGRAGRRRSSSGPSPLLAPAGPAPPAAPPSPRAGRRRGRSR